MKIKDLERTANVAWSPKDHHPIYLATATAAQQLDASFNTNSTLEIHALNLTDPSSDLGLAASVANEQRFHKIVWSEAGSGGGGTIIGGCDGGTIYFYNASKLLRGDTGSALVSKQEKHTGPVMALDLNPVRNNLLVSGAGQSEIFIWDLNTTLGTPMSPGAKSEPLEDVMAVGWNRQFDYILATTFASKCVIWDLRKQQPVIKVTDTVSVSRARWRSVAWHPDVSTQLCLASEEDHAPTVQIWDLRFATSPLRVLENHQRGVLSVAWCQQDANLLVSCSKDNRIICWNPNSNQPNGEILSEIAQTNQWSFDVQWCRRNPAIIACPSFDGHVSIYSLLGGKRQQIQTTNKIADSFPGIMADYIQAPVPQQNLTAPVAVDLTTPPKWFRKPVGVSFGFGGKLVHFAGQHHPHHHHHQTPPSGVGDAANDQLPATARLCRIEQVVTEADFVQKSIVLEHALQNGDFIQYCVTKAEQTEDQHKKYIWYFLKANFEENPRLELLNLLGYHMGDINEKLEKAIRKKVLSTIADQNDDGTEDLCEQLNNVNRIDDLDLCNSIPSTQKVRRHIDPVKILTGNDTDGLISQALLLGNIEVAVELCLQSKRFTEAIIIAMTGGPELLARTREYYLEQSNGYVPFLLTALVSNNWSHLVDNCDLSSWKEAMVIILSHCNEDEFSHLCEKLGDRLAQQEEFQRDSQLCYICAGSFDKLVNSWNTNAMNSTVELQELMELVNLLQKSVERQGKRVNICGVLASFYSQYASILASQGELKTALNYLGDSQDNSSMNELRDRLMISLNLKLISHKVSQQQQQQQYDRQRRSSGTRDSYSKPATPPVWHHHQQPPPPPLFPTMQQQAQASPMAVPPPVQPPRPPSVGSSSGGGLPSKKYVLDPSVASSNAIYSGSMYQSPQSQYGSPMTPNDMMVGGVFSPPMSGGGLSNSPSGTFASNAAKFRTGMTPPPSMMSPSQDNTMLPPPPPPPPSQNSYGDRGIRAPPVASGWNDPPIITKSAKIQHKPNPSPPPAQTAQPIMHPLYNPSTVGTNQMMMMNGGSTTTPIAGGVSVSSPPPPPLSSASHGQVPPYQPSAQSPQTLQPTANNPSGFATTFNPMNFKQSAIVTPSYGGAVVQQQPPPPPLSSNHQNFSTHPVPVDHTMGAAPNTHHSLAKTVVEQQKSPLPEEHMHLQTVLDELRSRCVDASHNPPARRKLDDVGKKLDVLYDLLRASQLSQNTTTLLHQIVQLIQNGDYNGALRIHTDLVSGPDFAQIASFMPGLKILLQSAVQLQVFVQ